MSVSANVGVSGDINAHMDRVVVVFARAPQLGAVKTRLAATLGHSAALEIYKELGRETVDQIRRALPCSIRVQFTPNGGEELIRDWLGFDVDLHPQCAGDLGCRMAGAIRHALDAGASRVVVVGTDCPALDSATIDEAFAALDDADVVIGPAHDGGYYLIAVRAVHRSIFEDIPWSHAETLSATLAAAERGRLRVTLLDPQQDIDTAGDWERWLASRGAKR